MNVSKIGSANNLEKEMITKQKEEIIEEDTQKKSINWNDDNQ
jgi:hypothetical protein